MKSFFKWAVAFTLVLGLGTVSVDSTRGQELFPEGPGRETLFLACVQCHPVDRMTNAQLSADDWEFILYDMISRGAPVYKKDIEDLKKYLVDNFAVRKQ